MRRARRKPTDARRCRGTLSTPIGATAIQRRADAPQIASCHDRLRRLAQSRTNRVLIGFPPLAKLTGPAYESTPEERRQIVDTLQKHVDDLKQAFFKEDPRKPSFSFD